MKKTLNGIKFGNIYKDGGISISDTLIQSSFNPNEAIPSDSNFPLVNAVDIDWNAAEVDENKVINTTGELLSWIKEGLSAAAQSGGSAELTEEQLETINTCSNLLSFIKQYALSTAYADEHYQAKGNYVLASVYNENKAAIDAAIEALQQAANGITEERIATIESNLSIATTALLAKVDEARVNAIIDAKGYQTEAQVNAKIQAVVGAAPEALDTLKEIADKLANNDDVVAGLTNQIAGKANTADFEEFVEEVNNANETTAEALVQLQENINNIQLTPGATGPQGPKGDKGDTGLQGPKGDTGAQGDTGLQGPKGDKGDTGTFDASALEVYATKNFVTEKIADVVGGAPETLDTLKEIADALNDNATMSDISNAISNKVNWTESTPGRNHIVLKNHDSILGTDIDGISTYNIAMVSKWNVADFGSNQIHMNLNTIDHVTINDNKVIVTNDQLEDLATKDELTAAIANVSTIKGDTGAQGPQGESGPKGDTGAKGEQGETGEAGPKGDTGAQGPQGEAGPKGDKGDTGTFDSSALAGYVTIEQYNALLARVAALEAQSGGDEPIVVDNAYITPTTAKPTSASIAEIAFPAQKPTEDLILETSEITRPTELYLVYPSEWVTANANDDITNPVITDTNGFAQGAWVDSIVTVNDVSYTIIGTSLGKDNYTITFN